MAVEIIVKQIDLEYFISVAINNHAYVKNKDELHSWKSIKIFSN